MIPVFLLARVVLAVVFLTAGAAKLLDREGSRKALAEFGVPVLLAGPLGVLLPVVEIGVALSFIPTVLARWAALAAVTLLLLFVAGIATNLARGRRPDCHCFGQLHSAPAGGWTLVRNLALAGVAGFVAWYGWHDRGDGSADWMSWTQDLPARWMAATIFAAAAAGVLFAQTWFLLHLLRQHGRLLLRLEALEARVAQAPLTSSANSPAGLPVGVAAPGFSLAGLYGETITLESLRAAGKPVLLLFSDPGCGACEALFPDIARWQRDHAAKLTIAVIDRAGSASEKAKGQKRGVSHVLLQKEWEIAQAYQVAGTPSAVIVRPDGAVGSPLAAGSEEIRRLVAQAVGMLPLVPAHSVTANGHGGGHHHATPTGRSVGEHAPTPVLLDLGGNPVAFADAYPHGPTVVLFWHPDCGFCTRMLDDLKAWEANPPEEAPQLLVVSGGSVPANERLGLRARMVLDDRFETGRAFAATGTPSAVLVDRTGKIASPVAVGAPAVLTLLKREPNVAEGLAR